MKDNRVGKAKDFRRAVERANAECVVLPASGLSVLLCRPPLFAAMQMGRTGTQLQAKITEAKPEEIRAEDIEALTRWMNETLARLFVEPRFAASPTSEQIGLADLLIGDLKFIFRWLRGEVFSEKWGARSEKLEDVDSNSSLLTSSSSTEDLGRFPGRQGAAALPGRGGEAQPLPAQRTAGVARHAGVPAGLERG